MKVSSQTTNGNVCWTISGSSVILPQTVYFSLTLAHRPII